MWIGDNLDVLRGMNSESVGLIYLDPPFNSNKEYSAPVGSVDSIFGRCNSVKGDRPMEHQLAELRNNERLITA